MRKKHSLLIVILFSIYFSSIGQEKESSNIELKVYYNYNRTNYYQNYNFSDSEFLFTQPEIINNNIGEFSLGIIFNKKFPFSHELEIMPLSLNKSTLNEVKNPSDSYNWEVSKDGNFSMNSRIRYQINYTIYDKSKFDLYVGFSSMLSFFKQNYGGYKTFDFQKKYTQVGIILGLTPGFEVPISKNMNFSFDVPIGILGLNYRRMNYESPELKLEEKKQSVISGDFWYQGFQIRAGLGFKF